MSSYFDISKDTPIYLYGAGSLGKEMDLKLKKENFNIKGFLDESIFIDNGPILFNNREKIVKKSRGYYKEIVIICIRNSLRHRRIAKKLYNLGFNKLLFLPTEEPFDNKEKLKMIRLYRYFLDSRFDKLICLSKYNTLMQNFNYKNASIVYQDSKHCVVWANIEVLYTGKIDKNILEKNLGLLKYQDIPLPLLFPYIELFEFIKFGKGGWNRYINHYKNIHMLNDNKNRKDYLKDRINLYKMFKNELNFGMDYFIESALNCTWNDRGYFNIQDGNHRAVFLYLEGLLYLPIKISNEDYVKWLNEEKLLLFCDYINKNKIEQTVTPIPHPYFKSFSSVKENTARTVLSYIFDFLGEKNYKEMTILDISQFQSYFARNFARMGCQNINQIDFDSMDHELSQKLNRLLYISNIDYELIDSNSFRLQSNYDLIFALGINNMLEESEVRDKVLMKLCESLNGFLFWKSELLQLEKDKNFILKNTDIDGYEAICRVHWDGDINEVGVFFRKGEN